jgi:hypothetical protein
MANRPGEDIKPQDLISELLVQTEHLIGRTVKVTTTHLINTHGRTIVLSGKPNLGKQMYHLLDQLDFTAAKSDGTRYYGGVRQDGRWLTVVNYCALVGILVINTTIPDVTIDASVRLRNSKEAQ